MAKEKPIVEAPTSAVSNPGPSVPPAPDPEHDVNLHHVQLVSNINKFILKKKILNDIAAHHYYICYNSVC